MRIAQLIETLGTGGAEKLAVDIAGARLRCGDESSIITLAELGPLSAGVLPGVALYNLGMTPDSHASQFFTLFKLYNLCRKLRLDALQTHLPRANFFGLVMATVAGVSVFPTVHNNREFDYGEQPGKLRKSLRKWAYGRLLVHGRAMIAVSAAVKGSLIEELDLDKDKVDRIAVVPNGVAEIAPLTADERTEVRREYSVPQGSGLIVGVGRLTPQKNFRDLVLALQQLGPEVPPWYCLIVGDGPLQEELAEQIRTAGLSDRIGLTGRISGVDRLLASADIFCMPSLWEGLPLALLEAMAAALPVAAYSIDGVRELVAEGHTGRLAAPGSVPALSAALADLLADAPGRFAMGRAGRTFVQREHGFSQMAARLGRVYTGKQERA